MRVDMNDYNIIMEKQKEKNLKESSGWSQPGRDHVMPGGPTPTGEEEPRDLA